ncbi:MAG: hypothetical protein IPK73_00565 [Candidatus Obscuribacter sp.]|nr:hypothetical protein [Candidatus Obscuribacter sp.]MBK9280509.1 hypothetical protein [Candidatus Obscuribacter sp.]
MTIFILLSLAVAALLTYIGVGERNFMTRFLNVPPFCSALSTATEIALAVFVIGSATKVPAASIGCMMVTGLALTVIGISMANTAESKKLQPVPVRAVRRRRA